MAHGGVGWRGVEDRLVGLAGGDGCGHGVVAFEDDALGAVLAVGGLVLAPHDRERVEDVVDVVALDAVEVEERGVKFRTQQEAPLWLPAERRAVVARVGGERLQVPGGAW